MERQFNMIREMRSIKNSRGSTLLIVLVILSVLSLIAATLSLTSRLEIISSANYAEGVQARMSAVTGVESASMLLTLNSPFTAYTQAWGAKGDGSKRFSSSDYDLADYIIVDESAKLNINAADRELLENAFASILKSNHYEKNIAYKLADEVIKYRLGPDGAPGKAGADDDGDSGIFDILADGLDNDKDGEIDNPEEILLSILDDFIDNNQDGIVDSGSDGLVFDGIDNDGDGKIDEKDEGVDEDDEFIKDPAIAPNGDDKPFLSIAELRLLPSMTDEIYSILSRYVTVYSSCDPVFSLNGKSIAKINVNTASANEIYELLREVYPNRKISLLKQFSVNIVDARDADSVPSQISSDNPDMPFLGVEKIPFIFEVWPDSITDEFDGDDGQYIELYNPYDDPVSVDGWKIEIGGTSVYLNGNIASRGFLIVTDDYNNRNDPDPEDDEDGYGSLYDIFGVVGNGSSRRIIEKRELEIPNESGLVLLKDKWGKLIDYFSYDGGNFSGVKRSFQRDDPRIRASSCDFCTPFKLNVKYSGSLDTLINAPFETRDTLFESPVDIMEVYAGFTSITSSGSSYDNLDTGRSWLLPQVKSSSKNMLDIRLVDIFIMNSGIQMSSLEILEKLGNVREDILYRLSKKYKKSDHLFGKLNLNTAPAELLAAIPGLNINSAAKMEKFRLKLELDIKDGKAISYLAPFENVSDIVDFLSFSDGRLIVNPDRSQALSMLRDILPYITVQSSSFTVYSENTFTYPAYGKNAGKEPRNPARSTVRALINLTPDGKSKIIDWCYLSR
jgi:type II secretory pathway component PulK